MSVTYFVFTYMYVKVCTADVQSTDGYIQFISVRTLMYPFRCSFSSGVVTCITGTGYFSTYQYILVRTQYRLVQEINISTDWYIPVCTVYVPK